VTDYSSLIGLLVKSGMKTISEHNVNESEIGHGRSLVSQGKHGINA
jgi:hypothetical protein